MATTATFACPRDLDFEGVSELEIVREGNNIILRPVGRPGAPLRSLKRLTPAFWKNVRTWSLMKDGLSYEEDLYARPLYLRVHHARTARSRAETTGAGGAVRSPHSDPGHYLRRDTFRRYRTESLATTCPAGRRLLRAP